VPERQLQHSHYLPFLRDISSSELSRLEGQVKATMDTPGWGVIERLWDERELALVDALVNTKADASAEVFAARSAEVRGLREARQPINALAEVAEQKRQEADQHV
jgi:hypothetical protein